MFCGWTGYTEATLTVSVQRLWEAKELQEAPAELLWGRWCWGRGRSVDSVSEPQPQAPPCRRPGHKPAGPPGRGDNGPLVPPTALTPCTVPIALFQRGNGGKKKGVFSSWGFPVALGLPRAGSFLCLCASFKFVVYLINTGLKCCCFRGVGCCFAFVFFSF